MRRSQPRPNLKKTSTRYPTLPRQAGSRDVFSLGQPPPFVAPISAENVGNYINFILDRTRLETICP